MLGRLRPIGTLIAVCMTAALLATASARAASGLTVTRATLANGLRVVVVHDPIAPVVTTILNYKVGSDEQSLPGEAHALEHMMFRGSKTLSSAQLMDTISITGGDFDADTQNQLTQYFFTMPSQYLGIALRLERSRATGLLLSQRLWNRERLAITQEVKQDNSNAISRLLRKMTVRLLGGTPYAKNTLGTVKDFATKVNSPQLKAFYGAWYHPNNAVYIIVGDVNGARTIARVKRLFGGIPAAKLPARPAVVLRPVVPKVYRDVSDQPYTIVARGYRAPGYDSSQYAALQILADVLNNQRSALYGLVAHGKAFFAAAFPESYSKVSMVLIGTAVPITTKPSAADAMLRGVLASYRKSGVPADLVAAAKRREIAQLAFAGNSIQGLAFQWSQAVAVQGLRSPDAMTAQYERVTTADVNRVLRRYLLTSKSVAVYAVPKNLGHVSMGAGMAKENNSIPPSHHAPLPSWAKHVLANLRVPEQTIHPTKMLLPNGITLIVQPETATKTVIVRGHILNDPDVQEPKGEEGIASLTDALFPYGTTRYDRLAFAAAQDAIAANVSAGTNFGLDVLSGKFARGMRLLADDELHPAFAPQAFQTVKMQQVGALAGEVTSPGFLTRQALVDALYPVGDPMRRVPTVQGVEGLTLAGVRAWYASAYRPDLTTIVVVGDVTPAQAKAVVEKDFGGWKAVGPKPIVSAPAVPQNKPEAVNVPATGRVQSSVQLVETIGLRRKDPSWAAIQIANAALSGGFYSSLLYHDLREVHGYAYYVASQLQIGKHRSTFAVRYGSNPGNVLPAQNQVVAILTKLQRQPLAARRLVRAKALLLGQVPLRQASYKGLAGLLLGYSAENLPLDQNLIDARAELSVTDAQVQAAMRRWVRPQGFVRIVTGPPPK
ncbi:MAG: M16 family metallopeptidase [Vulcanimicrobiaceae bacterium]